MTDNIIKSLISGGIAGGVSLFSIYPTEYLKLQKQINKNSNYKKIISDTFKYNGIKGFYKGFYSQLIGNVLSSSFQFAIKDNTKAKLLEYYNENTAILLSGITVGLLTPLIRIPYINISVKKINNYNEKIDNKLKINKKLNNKNNIISYYSKNPLKLWSGIQANLLKQTLGTSYMFISYDYFKLLFNSYYEGEYVNAKIILAGALAGSTKSFIDNPIDVIQSRLMSNYENKKLGILKVSKQLYKENGIKTFYSGCLLRSTRPIVGRSIMFYVHHLLIN